jgi:hypothetical protein
MIHLVEQDIAEDRAANAEAGALILLLSSSPRGDEVEEDMPL